MKPVPVLMYHALQNAGHSAGSSDPGEQLYVLPVEQFRQHMALLKRQGYRSALLYELQEGDQGGRRVVITFDDGHASNYTLALPVLMEFGFRAHFFITTGWIGAPGCLDEQEIRLLEGAGMSIGCHGVSHRFLNLLPAAERREELLGARSHLAGVLGHPVDSLSFPGGRLNAEAIRDALAAGYRTLCSSHPRHLPVAPPSQPVPRYAVSRGVTPELLAAVLENGLPRHLRLKHHLLSLGKSVLGNDRYQWVRGNLLAAMDRVGGARCPR